MPEQQATRFVRTLWEAKLMPRLNWRLCRLGYKLCRVDLSTLIHERLSKANATDFYFIQVGAFDGDTFDPITRYVKRYKLSGALIEPQQGPFSALKANYQNHPQLLFFNAAIDNAAGQKTFYRIKDDEGALPLWTQQLGSFSRENILKHKQGITNHGAAAVPEIERYIIEEQVPCITFDQVLDALGTNHVDLLQIDAEGYDFELIKAFPFLRTMPTIVRYEHMHLSKHEQRNCRVFLKRKGYRFVTELADTVAYLPKECGF